ncbi:transmembrane protein, putative (macronuclear) [Tetrahymena thermophila SB210]|uniref:Transmembrane protein, putative n=1 Tax=Tetrahymena thermophila (strain SB210) TaxID=312017 RepID=Q22W21_TETTS|nr:transmembrane protein, putative [Tetrahymena thermophila SB210]EAR89596.2 transmembrane protein, putative [Tetrahymena thermophila SB210]|eukprot:XP_001009841.2 transmembrane protein, putative [Tetrahymena thermophila SB210]
MSSLLDNKMSNKSIEIYCQEHKDKIIFLSYRQQNQQPQIEIECQTCRASKQKQTDWIYVVLSQLFQNNKNEMIYGFPPFKDDEFLKAYYEKINYNSQIQQESLEEIKQKFQAIKQEVIQKLESIEMQFFKQYEDCIKQSLSYQNEIYQMQQRDELISLVSENLNVDQKLQDFFKKQFQNLENKEAVLKDKINEYQKLVGKSMDFNDINQNILQLEHLCQNLKSFLDTKEDKMDSIQETTRNVNQKILNSELKEFSLIDKQEELNLTKVFKNEIQKIENEDITNHSEQVHLQSISQISNNLQSQLENQLEFQVEQVVEKQIENKQENNEINQNFKENPIGQQQINDLYQEEQVQNMLNHNNEGMNSQHFTYQIYENYDSKEDNVDDDNNDEENKEQINNLEGQDYQNDECLNSENFKINQGEIIAKKDLRGQIEIFINQCNYYLQNILDRCEYKWETLEQIIVKQNQFLAYQHDQIFQIKIVGKYHSKFLSSASHNNLTFLKIYLKEKLVIFLLFIAINIYLKYIKVFINDLQILIIID